MRGQTPEERSASLRRDPGYRLYIGHDQYGNVYTHTLAGAGPDGRPVRRVALWAIAYEPDEGVDYSWALPPQPRLASIHQVIDGVIVIAAGPGVAWTL